MIGERTPSQRTDASSLPVAPRETIAALQSESDVAVCLSTPTFFHAVGRVYDDFTQTGDEEVIQLLDTARQRMTHVLGSAQS